MTSEGTLYIDEECRDEFRPHLDEEFGKNTWRLNGDGYSDYSMVNMPKLIAVPIEHDETDEYLGLAIITNTFEIEEGWDGTRYGIAKPLKIQIFKITNDDKVCMQCIKLHSKTLHTKFGCCVPGCGCKVVDLEKGV